MTITGTIWKYGDDVNTDAIFPGRHTYRLMSEEEMGAHALEDFDPEFHARGAAGDIIVAGKNWGCGSAREQAVKALRARGVAALVAKGFSRIYYRNALNEGLLTIVCPAAVDAVKNGETMTIDLGAGVITAGGKTFPFPPYPEFVRGLIEDGGLVPHVKKKLAAQGKIDPAQ